MIFLCCLGEEIAIIFNEEVTNSLRLTINFKTKFMVADTDCTTTIITAGNDIFLIT